MVLRCAIVGAGAVGGVLAAALAERTELSVLARGTTLQALQKDGWRIDGPDGKTQVLRVHAADRADSLGPQDLVVVTVKAHALPEVAPIVMRLCRSHTRILVAMNGIGWWFLSGLEGPLKGASLDCIDPGGALERAMPAQRVIGAVVHWSASAIGPGRIRRTAGHRLIVGDALGGVSPETSMLQATLADGGMQVDASPRIQTDVWFKLWGNMTMNPLSALTRATCDRLLDDPLVTVLCHQVMREARDLGERLGLPIEQTPEARCAVTRQLGAFKTSMLQDVEAGRPLEVEALLGAVHEMARRLGVAIPWTDALYGLTRVLAASAATPARA